METLGTILMVAGGIGGLIATIILLIAAFKDNIWWGLGGLFCGLPLLIFCIMNFAEVKKPFLISIGCNILYFIGAGMAVSSGLGDMP
jgi:hypothetical protein